MVLVESISNSGDLIVSKLKSFESDEWFGVLQCLYFFEELDVCDMYVITIITIIIQPQRLEIDKPVESLHGLNLIAISDDFDHETMRLLCNIQSIQEQLL